MSGETATHESGWTVDTAKQYGDMCLDYERQIADERKEYLQDLRLADQRAIDLVQKNNDVHFQLLNENAKRTVEERGHFVSIEAFEPFRDQVLKALTLQDGNRQGTDLTMGKIYAAIGGVGAVLAIVVLLVNKVF